MKQSGKHSDNLWFIAILKQNKWYIAGFSLLAGIIVYFATHFITPEYTSSAIVYPAGNQEHDEMKLSQGSTLLLLQLLETARVKDSVIHHFNLTEHYSITAPKKKQLNETRKVFTSNTSFERTLYKSVKIEVRDHDPEFASRLANGIVEITNAINQNIFKANTHKKLVYLRKEYHNKKQEVDSLSQHIIQYQKQQASRAVDKIEKDVSQLESEISLLRQELDAIQRKHSVHDLNQQIETLKSDLNKTTNNLNIYKSARKVYKEQEWEDSLAKTEATFQGLVFLKQQQKSRLDSLQADANHYNTLTFSIAQNRSLHDRLMAKKLNLQSELNPEIQSANIELMKENLKNHVNSLNRLREKYEQALSEYEQPTPAAYTFSEARPSYEKTRPRTLLLTAGSMVLAFVLAISVLLLSKTLKQDEK
ncbi:MAG: Wzz/FepE/Etk N-terminal domain-containing protein [Bacteroidota bacterium]